MKILVVRDIEREEIEFTCKVRSRWYEELEHKILEESLETTSITGARGKVNKADNDHNAPQKLLKQPTEKEGENIEREKEKDKPGLYFTDFETQLNKLTPVIPEPWMQANCKPWSLHTWHVGLCRDGGGSSTWNQ